MLILIKALILYLITTRVLKPGDILKKTQDIKYVKF